MRDVGRTQEKFVNFLTVLPTSQVGYYAGKTIESAVFCFNEIHVTLKIMFQFSMGLLVQ